LWLAISSVTVQRKKKQWSVKHGWFSEGFDGLDLREAKALLDQL
jgi:hypothetical protein